MAWSVEFNDIAERQLRKLGRQWQKKILDYLEDEIASLDDPRSRGKALTGDKGGLWRYRVGDYRIICSLENKVLLILVVAVGHRREIYR
ncbi:MAG: type II toxin-antitoxin system RelE/ParE family toxin [Acidobacteriaceae bacterium]|nr:type II toxin-antitoxin system RelE/ParE family toxin [Acidobacteriaceae bacterium]